ncbi:MAG: 30S ribosomal protein S4 [Clostridiales bacterium]|jgi:small subunit ribosomal protein S4|nr:30S ribosomal protein S4 [Clostridiales bacterium]
MARYTGPVCKLCRREGSKLFLKGDRCMSEGCPFNKNVTPIAPGQHGASRKKRTEYGIQLREKQKTKRIYGLLESQFRSYYDKASNMRGVTGENMLILIERRLDNVVYRMGIATSRAQARQLIAHGHICVNGKKVDVPSFLVKENDIVSVRTSKQEKSFFKDLKTMKASNLPKWLTFDPVTLTGKVEKLPVREDIDVEISEHLIVELYSK